ncbi:MAG: Gfo/Idh/MocA family protein [Limisphaerales bacterium]
MDRREFLASSITLASLSAVDLLAQDATSPGDNRIAVGFLGGSHSHGLGKAKVLLEQPETWNIIGIVEESESVREKYAKLGIKAIDEEDLLANAQVIFVESDVEDHYRHGKTVLSSGKHLHLEKPPTMTLLEFQELEAIATSKKVLMQMGYMWRFNPGINAALEAVRNGWLGEVYLVKAEIGKLQSVTDRLMNNFPGGTMFELGCHVIDPVVRMLGRPTKVNAYNKTSGDYGDEIEDNTIAVLDYPKATAIVGSTILHHSGGSHRQIHVYGTNGNALIRPLDRPVMELDLRKAAGPYTKGKQSVEFPPYRRYVGEIQELADTIRSKKPLGITPETDLIVHETLLRACGVSEDAEK